MGTFLCWFKDVAGELWMGAPAAPVHSCHRWVVPQFEIFTSLLGLASLAPFLICQNSRFLLALPLTPAAQPARANLRRGAYQSAKAVLERQNGRAMQPRRPVDRE